MSVLLAGTCSTIGTTSLPCNNDAINVLKPSNSPEPEAGDNEDSVELNKYYVTLITEGNADTWYLATCVGKNNNGTYKMDHLIRVNKKSNLKWKNPTSPYITDMYPESILTWRLGCVQ